MELIHRSWRNRPTSRDGMNLRAFEFLLFSLLLPDSIIFVTMLSVPFLITAASQLESNDKATEVFEISWIVLCSCLQAYFVALSPDSVASETKDICFTFLGGWLSFHFRLRLYVAYIGFTIKFGANTSFSKYKQIWPWFQYCT